MAQNTINVVAVIKEDNGNRAVALRLQVKNLELKHQLNQYDLVYVYPTYEEAKKTASEWNLDFKRN